jgi:hypothetical protein
METNKKILGKINTQKCSVTKRPDSTRRNFSTETKFLFVFLQLVLLESSWNKEKFRFGRKISPSGKPPLKAHFHSRKISTDRKFSENIIVKSWRFSTSKFFSDGKFVGQSHFTKFSFCGKFSWVEMGLK